MEKENEIQQSEESEDSSKVKGNVAQLHRVITIL
jgi:hypothetical protein